MALKIVITHKGQEHIYTNQSKGISDVINDLNKHFAEMGIETRIIKEKGEK